MREVVREPTMQDARAGSGGSIGRGEWRRTMLILAAVIALGGIVMVATVHAPTLFGPLANWSGYRKDFTAFYAASSMLASGSGGAIYQTDAIAR